MSIDLLIEKLEEELDELTNERASIDADIARITAAVTALKGEVVAAPVATTTPLAPKPKAAKKPATKRAMRPGVPKYDYAEVARIACAAIEKGESAAIALMARYGVKRGNADQLVVAARKKGFEIPRKVTAETASLPLPIATGSSNGWRPGMAAAMAASVGDHDD